MNNAAKTPKVAGLAEQELPGDAALAVREQPPVGDLAPARLSARVEPPEAAAQAEPAGSARVLAFAEASTRTLLSPAADTHFSLRALERTHDLVALHATRLRESGDEALHVVIKPGAGVQLSLELRQRNGGIEAQALLHRGDFEHLSRHWTELQQRLEARGVRLAPLACHEDFLHHNPGGSRHSPREPQTDPLFAGAFAEFALAGSLSEPPGRRAARAAANRGWETWA